MKKKITLFLAGGALGAVAFLSPLFVFAASPNDLQGVIGIFLEIIGLLIPLAFAIALVLFLWGTAVYILKSEDATAQKEGRKFMLYGIIALFVMVSIWGLVGILGNTFDVDTRNLPFLPGFGGDFDQRGLQKDLDVVKNLYPNN